MNGDRLASVLRIRQLQEKTARGELARSRFVERSAESAERATWRALDERARSEAGSRSAASITASRSYAEAGMLAAETQRARTRRATEDVAVGFDRWTASARRLEGLERLAERNDRAEHEELTRKNANEIDDQVLVRFAGTSW
jgi:flagellar export protein FliJ